MPVGNYDGQLRRLDVLGAREIKASTNYSYLVNGITLDGSKFAAGELVLEGTCLVKDNASGKYEKYADGSPAPAVLNGTANITPALLSGIHAGTKVDILVDGIAFTITNAVLAAFTGSTTEANIIAAVKAAVAANGATLDDVTSVRAVANKLQIASDLAGQTLKIVVTAGAPADKGTIEGVLGITSGTTAVGAGSFPANKSNPVIIDQSVKFEAKDNGDNADRIVGQVLIRGDVYKGMLIGWTKAFEDRLAGAIRIL